MSASFLCLRGEVAIAANIPKRGLANFQHLLFPLVNGYIQMSVGAPANKGHSSLADAAYLENLRFFFCLLQVSCVGSRACETVSV